MCVCALLGNLGHLWARLKELERRFVPHLLPRRPGTERPPQWVSHDGFHSADDTCPRTAGHGCRWRPFRPRSLERGGSGCGFAWVKVPDAPYWVLRA